MKSQTNTKTGPVGSKTRSLGQIVEKHCVCFRDQIFGLILMKLGQSVCRKKILYYFENGSGRVKGWSLGEIRRSYACNQGVVIQIHAH